MTLEKYIERKVRIATLYIDNYLKNNQASPLLYPMDRLISGWDEDFQIFDENIESQEEGPQY